MQWDQAILDRGEVNVVSFKFKKMEAFKDPVMACIPNQDPPWTSKYSLSQKYLSILQSTSRLSLAKLDHSYRPNSKTVSISGDSTKSPQLKGKVHVLPLPPVDDTTPNSAETGPTKPKGCFLHPLKENSYPNSSAESREPVLRRSTLPAVFFSLFHILFIIPAIGMFIYTASKFWLEIRTLSSETNCDSRHATLGTRCVTTLDNLKVLA